MDYTLQANVKSKEGSAPPERDQQFRYINRLAQEYVARNEPVISVDAKKRDRSVDAANALSDLAKPEAFADTCWIKRTC